MLVLLLAHPLVVTKNIPPYSIAAGVPCRIIRKRFQDTICDRLINSLWWEMSDDDLNACAHFFTDPELFLDYLDSKNGIT